jgi:mannose-6-phosphate isomerase-like protein (cupin superfamily)
MKVQDISLRESPLETPSGEIIYKLIGRGQEGGGVVEHSLADILIPPGKSSALHYHKQTQETYYLLSGEGWMINEGEEFSLKPGQACLIEPGETHKITNRGKSDLEFLAFCVPAWIAEDSFEVE